MLDLKIKELNNRSNFLSIIDWIENNGQWFLNQVNKSYSKPTNVWPDTDDFNIQITYLTLTYTNVSNTHHCPRNGVTNWGCNNNLPRGYPGWDGRIEFNISHPIRTFGGDLFRNTGIHLGTGGSGNKLMFGYEVKFFDNDWPGLVRNSDRVMGILTGNHAWKHFSYGKSNYFR